MIFFSQTLPNIKRINYGFTLIELMLSIAVFSIVVLAMVGMIINVFQAQSKAIAVKDVFDNARFVLELMTRELRTSTNIRFTAIPPSSCPHNGLAFTSYNQGFPQERFYYWEDTDSDSVNDALMRVVMPAAGSIDCGVVTPQQVTAQEVIVDRWGVIMSGNNSGPADGQPRITIEFTMHSRSPQFGPDTKINLQTTITMRVRDL